MTGLVWFRQDLRLGDHPALWHAVEACDDLICLFVLEDDDAGARKRGGASRWWLHHSLQALAEALAARGNRLILRRGAAEDVITGMMASHGLTDVFWNRCYEPWRITRDSRLKALLADQGVTAHSHNGSLLYEPWTVKNGSGDPYKVFTPFWKAAQATAEQQPPLPEPVAVPAPARLPDSDALQDWALRPTAPDWSTDFQPLWQPGERGARARLEQFLETGLAHYAEGRDIPGKEYVSRLSPHLHFGEISPRQIWHRTQQAATGDDKQGRKNKSKFLAEVGWRDFSYNLLYHFPHIEADPLQGYFKHFPWTKDTSLLKAWQRGQTGIPMVDAGMRQLWQTGWMHNRVRMIAASFLVKNLLLHWREGEAWFWDTLVDADMANNCASWQWVAGCGADAAPYFRVFNPVLQGKKFDPDGTYVRQYVPELKHLPDQFLHTPWEAPLLVLKEAGVTLGETYPAPVVDLMQSRDRALEAYEILKRKRDAA